MGLATFPSCNANKVACQSLGDLKKRCDPRSLLVCPNPEVKNREEIMTTSKHSACLFISFNQREYMYVRKIHNPPPLPHISSSNIKTPIQCMLPVCSHASMLCPFNRCNKQQKRLNYPPSFPCNAPYATKERTASLKVSITRMYMQMK